MAAEGVTRHGLDVVGYQLREAVAAKSSAPASPSNVALESGADWRARVFRNRHGHEMTMTKLPEKVTASG